MGVVSLLTGTDPMIPWLRSSESRKRKAELRLRYYRDDQADDLLATIKKHWRDPESFRIFHVNVVKKIVDSRAMVYKAAPVRVVEGADQALVDDIYGLARADVLLKKANRITKLLKTTLLQVSWSGDRPRLSVVTPHIVDVEAEDPEEPTRVVITHPAARVQDVEYSDWTADRYIRRDYRGNAIRLPSNPRGINPYGRLPFVPLFDYMPEDAFFLAGGEDLIEAQKAINSALVNLWRAIEWQSHGQAWASGPGMNKGLTDAFEFGPSRIFGMPEGGKFGFAAPNAPINEILAAIEFLLKQTAMANGLAAAVFEVDAKAESGIAKMAESRDLIEARQDDIELWRAYEGRLFDVLRTVWNVHRPDRPIPEAAELSVDFGEVVPQISEKDRVAAYGQRVALGVWSAVDVLMADNPDIRDRDVALGHLLERQREQRELGLFVGALGADPEDVDDE